ncbi:hypothetical protein HY572_00015 [Candidatus Micrarchaeota archaeon]|nr:hypothetical protein [Candidatus Micrarchaeota archaeon]
MNYRTAGLAVFWVTVAITLAWGALNRLDVALVTFVVGLFFTEQAFVAAWVEESFPFPGNLRLSFLSAQLVPKHGFHVFDHLIWEGDMKDRFTPFTLIVHAKKPVRHAKKNAEKLKKEFGRVVGLQETDIQAKTAVAHFRDVTPIRQSVQRTLELLEKVWK